MTEPQPVLPEDQPPTPAQIGVAQMTLAALREAEQLAIRAGLDTLVSWIRLAMYEAERVLQEADLG